MLKARKAFFFYENREEEERCDERKLREPRMIYERYELSFLWTGYLVVTQIYHFAISTILK